MGILYLDRTEKCRVGLLGFIASLISMGMMVFCSINRASLFLFCQYPSSKKSCPWFLVKTAEILHKFTDNVGFKECPFMAQSSSILAVGQRKGRNTVLCP